MLSPSYLSDPRLYLLRSLLATSLDLIVDQETGRLAAECGIALC